MRAIFWNMRNLISSKYIGRSQPFNNGSNTVESGRGMDYITIIGLAAAALGGISLFPQLLRVLKTKSTKDISLGMIIIFSCSIFLWLVWDFDEKFAHHNRQFFWFYPSSYYPII
jgi:uncharacterized protein with PQ loop repeat